MSYADERERRETSRGGYLVTSDLYGGMVYYPSWSDTVYTPTTLIPIGPVADGGMRFIPHRVGEGECQFSRWICARHTVRGWGTTKQFTFLASQKDPTTGQFRDQQMNPNPVYDLWNAYRALCKIDKNWETLGEGGRNRRAAISRPDNYGYMQGMIAEISGKTSWGSKPSMQAIFPAILGFSRTARLAYESVLDARDENTGHLKVPDLFDPNNTMALRVFNEKTQPGMQAAPEQQQLGVPVMGRGPGRDNRDKDDVSRYKAELVPLGPMPPGPDGRPSLVGMNAFVEWDKAFRYLSDEEMVDLLCAAFQDHPQLLIYALGRKYRLPDTVLKGATSVQMAPPPPPSAPQIGVPGVGVPMMHAPQVPQQPGYPYGQPAEDEAMLAAAPSVGVMNQPMPRPPTVGQPAVQPDPGTFPTQQPQVASQPPQAFPQPPAGMTQPQQAGGYQQPQPQQPGFIQAPANPAQVPQVPHQPPQGMAPPAGYPQAPGQPQVPRAPQPPQGVWQQPQGAPVPPQQPQAAPQPPQGTWQPPQQPQAPQPPSAAEASGLAGLQRARQEMEQYGKQG